MKAALFDFDGTLVDLPIDYDSTRRRLKKLFSRFGIKSDFRPLLESIQNSLSKLKRKDIPSSSVKWAEKTAYSILNEEELRSVPKARLVFNAREVLSFLKEKQVKIAIVSRNGKSCIESCISRLNIPKPDLVVAREDVKNLKPSPEHVKVVLQKLRLRPSETILVGDTFHDIVAGKKLGIRTVLIANVESRKEKKLKPSHVISNLSEILNLIKLY